MHTLCLSYYLPSAKGWRLSYSFSCSHSLSFSLFHSLLLSCSISHPQLHIVYFSSSIPLCFSYVSHPLSLCQLLFVFLSTSMKCFLLALLLVYRFLPYLSFYTCQFLGRGGLFGDRWRSAFHLNGDPGGETGLGGREQLLIGRGVSPCHYAPSAALLLDQCHSVSQSVARRHRPGRRKNLVVLTVRHFWGRAREDLDLPTSSLSVALRPRCSCSNGCFSMACPLVAVNFVSYH